MFYTPALGLAAAARGDREYYAERFGVAIPADRIMVTAGSSAALLMALGLVLDIGDTRSSVTRAIRATATS